MTKTTILKSISLGLVTASVISTTSLASNTRYDDSSAEPVLRNSIVTNSSRQNPQGEEDPSQAGGAAQEKVNLTTEQIFDLIVQGKMDLSAPQARTREVYNYVDQHIYYLECELKKNGRVAKYPLFNQKIKVQIHDYIAEMPMDYQTTPTMIMGPLLKDLDRKQEEKSKHVHHKNFNLRYN